MDERGLCVDNDTLNSLKVYYSRSDPLTFIGRRAEVQWCSLNVQRDLLNGKAVSVKRVDVRTSMTYSTFSLIIVI